MVLSVCISWIAGIFRTFVRAFSAFFLASRARSDHTQRSSWMIIHPSEELWMIHSKVQSNPTVEILVSKDYQREDGCSIISLLPLAQLSCYTKIRSPTPQQQPLFLPHTYQRTYRRISRTWIFLKGEPIFSVLENSITTAFNLRSLISFLKGSIIHGWCE